MRIVSLSLVTGVFFAILWTAFALLDVRRFRTSLLDHPARSGLPVHAAALTCRTPPGEPPAHLSVCW